MLFGRAVATGIFMKSSTCCGHCRGGPPYPQGLQTRIGGGETKEGMGHPCTTCVFLRPSAATSFDGLHVRVVVVVWDPPADNRLFSILGETGEVARLAMWLLYSGNRHVNVLAAPEQSTALPR